MQFLFAAAAANRSKRNRFASGQTGVSIECRGLSRSVFRVARAPTWRSIGADYGNTVARPNTAIAP